MAKKTKKTPTSPPAAEPMTASISPTETAPPSSKGKKTSSTSAKKPAAPRAAKGGKKAVGSRVPEPTDEEIRIRAYFISERRHRFDLAGDASSDWLEAKRQLLSEAADR